MYVKYPRTLHLPWSEGITNDDKVMDSNPFDGKHVIITEKLDGENTSIYHDHIHARSIDSKHHPSRDWVKQFWGQIRHDIPPDLRICGENVAARHSIWYNNLTTYFYGFSVWMGNTCLDWESTLDWFELLDVTPVPVLYDGIFNEKHIASRIKDQMDFDHQEGYVIRLADQFDIEDFQTSVGKYVRKGHVQSDQHWMHQEIVFNRLKND